MKRRLKILKAYIRCHAYLLFRGMWRGECMSTLRIKDVNTDRKWRLVRLTAITAKDEDTKVFYDAYESR